MQVEKSKKLVFSFSPRGSQRKGPALPSCVCTCEHVHASVKTMSIKNVTMSGEAFCIKALWTRKKGTLRRGDEKGRSGGGGRDEQLNLSNPFAGED